MKKIQNNLGDEQCEENTATITASIEADPEILIQRQSTEIGIARESNQAVEMLADFDKISSSGAWPIFGSAIM